MSAALREAELALIARFKIPGAVELPGGHVLEYGKAGGNEYGLRVRHNGDQLDPLLSMSLTIRIEAAYAIERLIAACEAAHASSLRRTAEAAEHIEGVVERLRKVADP